MPHNAAAGVLRRAASAVTGLVAALVLLGILAGVPYALARGMAWPLPSHLPTTTEIRATLTGPFTDHILLDCLACLCWTVWALFVIDIARAIPGALLDVANTTVTSDDSTGRHVGPLRMVATLLVVTIVSGLFSLRSHTTLGRNDTTALTSLPPYTAVVSPAGRTHTPEPLEAVSLETRVIANDATDSVLVQAPHAGIHDSLWRIAARRLGDGSRWKEIYRLNKGHPQPDGQVLTQPSVIQPGWVFTLPAPDHAKPQTDHLPPQAPAMTPTPTTPAPAAPTPAPLPRPNAPATSFPAEGSATRSEPTPSVSAPVVHTPDRASSIDTEETLLGIGFAAAVSAALITARRRRQRGYVPGSGYRDDLLPVAPVVRSLHLAHLHLVTPALADFAKGGDVQDGATEAAVLPNLPASARIGDAPRPGNTVAMPVGVAAEHETAVDIAATQGLGLVGPGTADTARALLLHALTHTNPQSVSDGPIVLVPSDTAARLRLPHPGQLPTRLRLAADLTAALDEAETLLLRSVRSTDQAHEDPSHPLSMLIVTSAPTDTRRLQAILDTGTTTGVGAIVLGQWRTGTSVYVAADGAVTASSPGPGEALRGTRLFHLTSPAAADILVTLSAAEPATSTHTGDEHTEEQPAHGRQRATPTGEAQPANPTHPVDLDIDAAVDTAASVPTDSAVAEVREPRPPRDIIGSSSSDENELPTTPEPVSTLEELAAVQTLRLKVLGPVRLTWHPDQNADNTAHEEIHVSGTTTRGSSGTASVDLTGTVTAKLRELLVVLAVHPEGITRAHLADTLWPDTTTDRPYATLNKNLARLRNAVTAATGGQITDITITSGDRHLLNPAVVQTDYTLFSNALAARRAAQTDDERSGAYRQIIDAYRGELAQGLAADWLETTREALRRDAVDAASSLARLVYDTDPRTTLELLDTGRTFAPHNEAIYRDIMRLQHRLGQSDAIEQTFTLLTTQFAELEETPEPETLALFARLRELEVTRPVAG